MKIWHFVAWGLALSLIAGCANDPMKPARPFGKRVPVNITPPPVAAPLTPMEGPESVTSTEEMMDG